MKKAIPGEISEKEDMKAEAVNKAPRSLIAIIAPSARSKWMHSRFFVNLVNLVGWSSPTKHLVHVAYFLVGDAHPTPYGKARLAVTILYDIPGYAVRSFFLQKIGNTPLTNSGAGGMDKPRLSVPARTRKCNENAKDVQGCKSQIFFLKQV
ncbi:MAG: hypothetical protein HUU08_02565 [Candidatus Brocadia sp.]|nr:hypothetical protein [Candidatus Brocadia sp.]